VDSDVPQRRLAAILSADAVGYSRLMARDEVATLATLAEHRREIQHLVRSHRGRVVGAPGDNVLAELPSATDAVTCALQIQHVLAARNAGLSEERRLAFRIGIHLGEVLVEGDEIYGSGINIAARLEGLAPPGGICLSAAVRDQLSGRLEVPLHDLGELRLKNIPQPIRAFAVSSADPGGAPGAAERRAEQLSVAVLAFDNLSGDPDQEYFSDGMAEDLITDLSALSGLVVIGRHSSFAYKGRQTDVRQIARELGVRYVVSGSVRRTSQRVRVTASLIAADSGRQIWAERYDRELTGLFELQDEVRTRIVEALRPRLTGRDLAELERSSAANLEAYDHVLRARAYRRRFTPENARRLREHAERAIALDPALAEGYALLADVAGAEWILGFDADARGIPEVERLAHRALEIDPTSAWAHWVLGMSYRFSGRLAEALAEARTAIALQPNLPDALHLLATVLLSLDRCGEAEEVATEAIRLDPLRWEPWTYRAAARFHLSRLEEAERDQQRAVELYEEGRMPLALLAAIRAERGDLEGAREAARSFREDTRMDLEQFVVRTVPNPGMQARVRAALRRAGLLA
jgi:adenylate cyclase